MREEDGREIPAETGANLAQTEEFAVDRRGILWCLVGTGRRAPAGMTWVQP